MEHGSLFAIELIKYPVSSKLISTRCASGYSSSSSPAVKENLNQCYYLPFSLKIQVTKITFQDKVSISARQRITDHHSVTLKEVWSVIQGNKGITYHVITRTRCCLVGQIANLLLSRTSEVFPLRGVLQDILGLFQIATPLRT